MGLRRFADASGREWQAWDTYPTTNPERHALDRFLANQPKKDGFTPGPVRQRFEKGWLTFTAGDERRRLAPVPTDWFTADEQHLRMYLQNAQSAGPAIALKRWSDRPR